MDHETPKTSTVDNDNDRDHSMAVEQNWVDHRAAHDAPPLLSVRGGYDTQGSALYIGRVFHEGSACVANVRPFAGIAVYGWQAAALSSAYYQLLAGDCFQWVWHDLDDDSGTALPLHAVKAGQTLDGVDVYIGRGRHAACLVAGNVYTNDGLHVPYEGAVVRLRRFQVLTQPL